MHHLNKAFGILALCLLLASCRSASTYKIASPGQVNELVFELTKEGQPLYSFYSHKKQDLSPSPMGFVFDGTDTMNRNFELLGTETKSHDSTWNQPWGESKTVRDNHNEFIVHLKEKGGKERIVDIVFRVFDDGLGFRYVFPKQPNLDKVRITDETTAFHFANDHDLWWTPVH